MSETGNRLAMQEGYTLPFHAYGRTGRRSGRGHGRKSQAFVGQQSQMKKCAAQWRRTGRGGSYRSFMKGCLKRKGR